MDFNSETVKENLEEVCALRQGWRYSSCKSITIEIFNTSLTIEVGFKFFCFRRGVWLLFLKIYRH